MNQVLFTLQLSGHSWVITPWKVIGYLGVTIFAARWIVQVIYSHRAGRSHIPQLFWYMSLVGSLLLLAYFSFSNKNDSVGVLSNLFPSAVATYNLLLGWKGSRARASVEPKTTDAPVGQA